MSPYISVADHRRLVMRAALDRVADEHDLPITVRHLVLLADAATRTLYPAGDHGDPAPTSGPGSARKPARRPTGQPLTPDELLMFRYAANGLANARIGALMGCSVDAVKTCMRRGYTKLGARDRAHAVAILYAAKVLTADDIGGAGATR